MPKWKTGKTGGTANVSNIQFLKNEPSPKQLQFLESTKRYVGYGGARGGAGSKNHGAAAATIGTAALLGEVNWLVVGSAALLAGVLLPLTSIAGLPEVGD